MGNSWKVILATMLIFGTGVITGGLLVRNSMRSGMHPPRAAVQRMQQPATPGNMRIEFLRRVQRELNLTPEQRGRIDDVLKESQERSRRLMEPVAPKLREQVQKTREEFRAVLTAEQQKRFDSLWKQQQRPRESRKERAGARTNSEPSGL